MRQEGRCRGGLEGQQGKPCLAPILGALLTNPPLHPWLIAKMPTLGKSPGVNTGPESRCEDAGKSPNNSTQTKIIIVCSSYQHYVNLHRLAHLRPVQHLQSQENQAQCLSTFEIFISYFYPFPAPSQVGWVIHCHYSKKARLDSIHASP